VRYLEITDKGPCSIGSNHQPTYSSEPEQCETETATLCMTTSSIGAETTLVASACADLIGCAVRDSDSTVTVSSPCSTTTVTDYFVSCITPEPGVSSCTTTSSVVESGCSVTASATTEFGACVLMTTHTITIEEIEPPSSATESQSASQSTTVDVSESTADPEPTGVPLRINSQNCYLPSETLPDVAEEDLKLIKVEYQWQRFVIIAACSRRDVHPLDMILSPDSEPFTYIYRRRGVPYWYSVSWIKGCVTSVESQHVWQPVPGEEDTCRTLFEGNFLNCKSLWMPSEERS